MKYILAALAFGLVSCGTDGKLDTNALEAMQATATETPEPTAEPTKETQQEIPVEKTEKQKDKKEKEVKNDKEEKKIEVVTATPTSTPEAKVTTVPIVSVRSMAVYEPAVEATVATEPTTTPEPTIAPTQEPTATPTATPVPTATPFITMVSIPSGTFQRDDNSSNTSFVSAFHMSDKEITREQFVAMGFDDYSFKTVSMGITDPMQNVSWYQALVFCNLLSIHEGLDPVYSIGSTDTTTWGAIPTSANATWNQVSADWNANGYRLPTESEWQWAAMGATDDYQKSFAGVLNDLITKYVWYGSNSGYTSHPVGTKLPNELGLYDMSGNVTEWTWDLSAAYPSGSLTNYKGSNTGLYRIIRGGSNETDAMGVSIAFRNHNQPYGRSSSLGFRVVSK